MSHTMTPELDHLDTIYCIPPGVKLSDQHIEILGFKQDMNKKTFLTDPNLKSTTENLISMKPLPEAPDTFEDEDAYSLYFRFRQKEGCKISLRHLGIQSVLFKDVHSLVPHLDKRFPFSGQTLLKFYEACHEEIRLFCQYEKTEYFSNLKKLKPPPTVTVKDVTRKSKQALSQQADDGDGSGSNNSNNVPIP